MATVLRTYAGTGLVARVTWWNPGRVSIVDSSGHVARLRLVTVSPPYRTLLQAEEWRLDEPPTPPPGVVSLPGETTTTTLPTLDPAFAHLRSILSDVQVVQPEPTPPEPPDDQPELRSIGGDVPPPGTAFVRLRPGVWEMRLGATLTRILPTTSRFEIDVTNESDPEDVARIVRGVIYINPGGGS